MKRNSKIDHLLISVCVLGGVLAVASTMQLLTSLSTPHDFDPRLKALRQARTTISRDLKTSAAAKASSQDMCDGASPEHLERIRMQLHSQATGLGVQIPTLSLLPGPQDQGAARRAGHFMPVSLYVDAVGPYDAVTRFIDGLSSSKPAIYVTTAHVAAKDQRIQFKLSGRVFCRTGV